MGELQQKADRVNLFVHQKNRLEKIGEIFKAKCAIDYTSVSYDQWDKFYSLKDQVLEDYEEARHIYHDSCFEIKGFNAY